MTVMVWYSQGGGTCCVTVMVWYSQGGGGGGYMLCDSDGMVQSRWEVHVV